MPRSAFYDCEQCGHEAIWLLNCKACRKKRCYNCVTSQIDCAACKMHLRPHRNELRYACKRQTTAGDTLDSVTFWATDNEEAIEMARRYALSFNEGTRLVYSVLDEKGDLITSALYFSKSAKADPPETFPL